MRPVLFSTSDFVVDPGESIVAASDRLIDHFDALRDPEPSAPHEVVEDVPDHDPQERGVTILARPHRRV